MTSEEFFKQMVAQLESTKVAVENEFYESDLERLIAQVSAAYETVPSPPSYSCAVSVHRESKRLTLETLQTVLYHQPINYTIRWEYEGQRQADIELQPSPEGLVAVKGGIGPMTAQQLADEIMWGMVNRLRRLP
jgi:hypothetical protein